jgi:predicted N-acetyltransferase YhbS
MAAEHDWRIRVSRREDRPTILATWNAALGSSFPLRAELLDQRLDHPRADPELCFVADREGQVCGVAVASAPGLPYPADLGHIGWLVVSPAHRGRGIGGALLDRAETELAARGRSLLRVGGDPAHLLPACPSGHEAWFERRGYRAGREVHDLTAPAAALPELGALIAPAPRAGLTLRLARPGDGVALEVFFAEAFPGRWEEDILRLHTDGGDLLVLTGPEGGVEGFAALYRPGAAIIGPGSFWPGAFDGPLGGLGPMGLRRERRGGGLGLALLAEGCRTLVGWGARHFVVDWTDLVDFYGLIGFRPWRSYRGLERAR